VRNGKRGWIGQKVFLLKHSAKGWNFYISPAATFIYDPRLKKVVAGTANILNKAWIDFGILRLEIDPKIMGAYFNRGLAYFNKKVI